MGLWLKKSDGTVVEINSDGIAEAPEDGKQYARQDAAWSEVEAAEVLRGDPNNPPADWATDQLLYDGIEDDGSGGGGGSFEGEHVPTGDPSDPATLDMVDEGQLLYDGVEGGGSGDGGGPHDHDYLPLEGGTVTGDLQVDGQVKAHSATLWGDHQTISLLNATPTGQPHLGLYHNGVRKGYLGNATATTTELHAETNELVLGGNGVRVATHLTVDGDGQTLSLMNSTPAGQPYMGFYHKGVRKGYLGNPTATTTELSAETNQLVLGGNGVRVGTNLQVDGTLNVGAQIDTDYIRIGDGNSSWPTLSFVNDPQTGIYSAAPWVLAVNKNLQVDGQITDINGPVRSFAIADGIDTADVLERAETATMPVVDDDGVATTDADVEAITVNEVVTALLAKVKELSAEIEELKGN